MTLAKILSELADGFREADGPAFHLHLTEELIRATISYEDIENATQSRATRARLIFELLYARFPDLVNKYIYMAGDLGGVVGALAERRDEENAASSRGQTLGGFFDDLLDEGTGLLRRSDILRIRSISQNRLDLVAYGSTETSTQIEVERQESSNGDGEAWVFRFVKPGGTQIESALIEELDPRTIRLLRSKLSEITVPGQSNGRLAELRDKGIIGQLLNAVKEREEEHGADEKGVREALARLLTAGPATPQQPSPKDGKAKRKNTEPVTEKKAGTIAAVEGSGAIS